MQLTETKERKRELVMKKNNNNNNNNNGMAHCSLQERKIIMAITKNLPYPFCSLQVVGKKNVKSLIFLSVPVTE